MRVYKKQRKIYAVYDVEDNIAGVFDTGKECAEWFGIKAKVFRSAFSKLNKGTRDKIKNKYNGNFYKVYKFSMEDE